MPVVLQAVARLVALKRLGVLLFVLLATLCATHTASAHERPQTKTRVRNFELAEHHSHGLSIAAKQRNASGKSRCWCPNSHQIYSYRWRDPSGRGGEIEEEEDDEEDPTGDGLPFERLAPIPAGETNLQLEPDYPWVAELNRSLANPEPRAGGSNDPGVECKDDPAAEGVAPIIESTELTGVQANKVIGDAAADELAESLRQAGLTVEREVPYRTPIGTRIADLRVSEPNGAVRGLVEVKVGNSPYTSAQQLKDWFIESIYGHPTNVVRY